MTYPMPGQQYTAQQATSALAPSVPLYVTSAAFDSGAVVYWQHPGDHAVTSFTVTPYITGTPQAATSVNGGARQASITGLTNSTAYTFSVHATNAAGSSAESAQSGANTPLANLVFGDDFNGPAGPGVTGLSPCWTILSRDGDQSNNETSYYLPSQVTLDGSGHLALTLADNPFTAPGYNDGNPPTFAGASVTRPYLGGMVQWAYPGALAPAWPAATGFTLPGFNFTYGTVQVSMQTADLPGGGWNAVWMLGSQCQPSNVLNPDNVTAGGLTCNYSNAGSEEIDIANFNSAGNANNYQMRMSNAGAGYGPFGGVSASAPTQQHIYEVDWTPASLTWKFDGSVTAGPTGSAGIPSTPQFLVFQLTSHVSAVSSFAAPTMLADWVRVFRN